MGRSCTPCWTGQRSEPSTRWIRRGLEEQEVIYEVLDLRYFGEEEHDRIGGVMVTVFDLKVDRGETTANFTGKVRAAFAATEAEGIPFPSAARGYMLLRFAKVTLEKRTVILAAARQSYEERSLRMTYPDQPRGVHAMGAALDAEEADEGFTQAVLAAEEFDFEGEEPVEEQDAIEVLLSCILRGLPPKPKPDAKKLEARVRKQIGHSGKNYVYMAWPHGEDVQPRRSMWQDGGGASASSMASRSARGR